MTQSPDVGPAADQQSVDFAFRFSAGFRMTHLPFGITQANSMITVTQDRLRVRFGPWRVSTPLANIRDVSITGPYLFVKTAGPARLTFRDRGLTFATNNQQGVCIDFHEPIPGIEPTRRLRHPNLTLTPADCKGLARLLGDGPRASRDADS
ncbi:MAG TPA: hypothetical protein VGN35_11395 [Jatrophihabitantaceae bacterium]|jgi:hypothetical protein|nr:hypothetical protein [Jatrophihabitantaceae bacterium]